MSADAALLERLAPNPVVGARAERGRAWLGAHGLPDGREEGWKYTPVDDIRAALAGARPAPDPPTSIDKSVVDQLAGDHGGPRLVFVNGVLAAALSDLDRTPGALWLGGAEGLRPRRKPGAPPPQDEPADGFHALNWAAGRDVAAVLAEPGADPGPPIHVVHLVALGEGVTATHPRTVVRAGRGSRLHVIETYVGLGGRPLTNASTRILAGEGASITYQRVVAEHGGSIHVGRTGIELARGSAVTATSVITGGHIVRSALDVRLSGVDASVALQGLYLPTGNERHDNVVTVDHAASHCTSTQRFKGIVDDHARGSFSGHVIVRPGTVGTDATQSNPSLVLAPTAQADTRPWLEILADDVRCSHGAAVGRLDHDAIFYLRSRGISLADSRAMLVEAFAAEVIDGIAPPSLRDWVATAAGRRPQAGAA